jgi:Na+-driven multidrug efflux pump
MMSKGETHLSIVSFGSVLVGTFIFINEGMSEGIVTIASTLIGAKRWKEVWKLYYSAFLFSLGTIVLLSIPLVLLSDITIMLFFKSIPDSYYLFQKTCFWVWVLLIGNAANLIGVSFLAASKDTTFHMLANFLSWIVCYLPVWIGIGVLEWPADRFWAIQAIEPLIIASVFHLRLRKEKWKQFQ